MDDEERLTIFRIKLKDLLDQFGSSFHKDGAFCTTYFLTAEFFDGDGQYWASTIYDDKSPSWRISGLVQHALENDFVEELEEED